MQDSGDATEINGMRDEAKKRMMASSVYHRASHGRIGREIQRMTMTQEALPDPGLRLLKGALLLLSVR